MVTNIGNIRPPFMDGTLIVSKCHGLRATIHYSHLVGGFAIIQSIISGLTIVRNLKWEIYCFKYPVRRIKHYPTFHSMKWYAAKNLSRLFLYCIICWGGAINYLTKTPHPNKDCIEIDLRFLIGSNTNYL